MYIHVSYDSMMYMCYMLMKFSNILSIKLKFMRCCFLVCFIVKLYYLY